VIEGGGVAMADVDFPFRRSVRSETATAAPVFAMVTRHPAYRRAQAAPHDHRGVGLPAKRLDGLSSSR